MKELSLKMIKSLRPHLQAYRKEFSFFIRCFLKLLPLQGALLTAFIPRALPWAKSFCPFYYICTWKNKEVKIFISANYC